MFYSALAFVIGLVDVFWIDLKYAADRAGFIVSMRTGRNLITCIPWIGRHAEMRRTCLIKMFCLGFFFRTKLFQEGSITCHFKSLKQTWTRSLDFVANIFVFLFIVLPAVSVVQIKDCSEDTFFTRTVRTFFSYVLVQCFIPLTAAIYHVLSVALLVKTEQVALQ